MKTFCRTKIIDLNRIVSGAQYFSMFYETFGNANLRFSLDGGVSFVESHLLKDQVVNIADSVGHVVVELGMDVEPYNFYTYDAGYFGKSNVSIEYISQSTNKQYSTTSDDVGLYEIYVPADIYAVKVDGAIHYADHIVKKTIREFDNRLKDPAIYQFLENQDWTEHCVFDTFANLNGFVDCDDFIINNGLLTHTMDNRNGLKYWALAFK